MGDFNNDGIPDLVTPGYAADQALAFHPGGGTCDFQPPVMASAYRNRVSPLVATDLNRDGNLDLIAREGTDAIQIFFGDGQGRFNGPVLLTSAPGGQAVATGDLNGDGLIDIALGFQTVGASPGGSISIFNSAGGQNFAFAKSIPLPSTYGVGNLDAADVDNDGHVDLVALSSASAVVLWSLGSQNFRTVTLKNYASASNAVVSTSVSDVNQDGAADILVAYSCSDSLLPGKGAGTNSCSAIGVFHGQGNQTTFYRPAVADAAQNFIGSVLAIDLNGDGLADLVGVGSDKSGSQTGVFVWQQRADGSFDTAKQRYILSSDAVGSFFAADFNRDGKMDLVLPYFPAVLLNATLCDQGMGCERSQLSLQPSCLCL